MIRGNNVKAIQLIAEETLAVRDLPVPEAGKGDVLIRVRASGVCETDLHVYRRGDRARLPLTLGHEFAGEIAAVGPGVSGLLPGDRVAVEPCVVCGECRFCRSGRTNLCAKLDHLGLHSDGSFAEFVAAPARNAHRLPDGTSWIAGALVEPFGCALHGLRRAHLQPGDDVLIIGDGFFGMVFTQLAHALDAGRVVVLGHHEDRLAMVREQGADVAIDERAGEVPQIAAGLSGGFGPAVVVDTVGAVGSFAKALELAGRGGTIALFGAVSREATIPSGLILGKELDVVGIQSSPNVWPEVVSLLASARIQPERLVSRVLSMDDLEEAFNLKASRASSIIKLVVTA